MEGDIKISAVFSLTDKLSDEDKSKISDVSPDVHGLTTESQHADLATENTESSADSVNSDGGATDESPPILVPIASNSFTSRRCPRAVANSSPPVLELEEMKSDVASNYPILPLVDPQTGVKDKTPARKICRKIAPSYIVLKRIDKYLINGSSTSVRLFKRRFSDCYNMCKKIQFMRRLKSGKDVFDVITPSKLTTSGLYLNLEKDKSNKKNKKSNIKPKNGSNGNQMKRVNRKISKLPNDFRSWQSFMKKSFAAEEEANLTDNDRNNVENWQKHVCDAFLLRKQILIKRSHNKKVKLLKLRSRPDMDMPSILKSEVKSNVSGRVCKPNTKYLADFLLNKNEFLEQKHVFETNNQLKRLANQSNILKEKGMSSSNDKRTASKKRKPTPDIVIENLEGNCVTTYNKTPDLLPKKLKKSVSKQMTDIHKRAQRRDAQQKSSVSNNAGKDGVIIQEMPNEQSVIAELLQSKPLSSPLSINSKTTVLGERTNAPAISSSPTSKELRVTSSVVKVVKSIQPKLAGLTTYSPRPDVGLNSATSCTKILPNLETNKVLITSQASNTSSHLVTNQYGVTYLFHHKAPDGNVPIIKLMPPVTSSLNKNATHDDLQKSYGHLKSLVPSSVSTLLSQSSYKSVQSITNEVNPRREEPVVLEPSTSNTSDGLKTGLLPLKSSLSPIHMTNTTTVSKISPPNVKTTWQSIAPSVTKCAKVPMTQSTFPGFSILPQNLNANIFNGTPQQHVNKSTPSVVSAASPQVPLSAASNGAVPIASSSTNSNVAAGNVKSVFPNKGKFYLLKIDGKNVLIPTDGVTLQPNACIANDMSIGTTRTTSTALVDSNKCLSDNSKPTLAAGQNLKVVLPQFLKSTSQFSSTPPPIKIKQEPMDDCSEHLLNSTTSISNIPIPTSTKVMEPTASIVNVRERLSAKLNETITKKGSGNAYQGHVLVLNKNISDTAGSSATPIHPLNTKLKTINIDNSANMPNVSSLKTETSETAEITHSSIHKEVKPVPFTEALSAREEKLRKLKELLKEKQMAVEAIRNTK